MVTGGHNTQAGACEDRVGDVPGHSWRLGPTLRLQEGLGTDSVICVPLFFQAYSTFICIICWVLFKVSLKQII